MKKIFLFFFWLFAYIPAYAQMTFTDIILDIRSGINDSGPYDYHFSTSTLIRKINAVMNEACSLTGAIEGRAYYTTYSGVREYSLPSDCIGKKVLRAAYWISPSTSSFKRLEQFSIPELDAAYNKVWENRTSGLPINYYLRADKIGLVPAPSATYSTSTAMMVDYIKYPAQASSVTLSSYPFSGLTYLYPYHKLIVIGVIADITGNVSTKQEYYALLERMMIEVNDKPDAWTGKKIFDKER